MSYFGKTTNTESTETGTQEAKAFTLEAGIRPMKLIFAGIYGAEISKGLILKFESEDGVVVEQYMNFINKKGESTRELNGGMVKGFGLAQVEALDGVLQLGAPTTEVEEKLWGTDKKAMLMRDALGKIFPVGLQLIDEENEEGVWYMKNEIAFVLDENGKTSSELYFNEDDSRCVTIEKFEKRIEKTPIIKRKHKSSKGGSKAEQKKPTKPANAWGKK